MARTQIVSFSELDTLRQCPHKHALAYRERWVGPVTGPALRRGILWHSVMEAHYRFLMRLQQEQGGVTDPRRALLLARREVMKLLVDETGHQTEDQELILWMYDGYVEFYGDDPDWEILAVEHAPQVWLPTPTGGRSRFKLKLKIDLIARERGTRNIWVIDHKSGKDLPSKKELDIDDQFGLYTWALRSMGKNVFGSIHSAARTQRNKDQTKHFQPLDERFMRTRLYRTDQELDTLAIEAYRTFTAGYRMPTDLAPRSPNPDTCRWRCDYTDPCLASRKGADEVELLTSLGFVQDYTRH